MDDTALPTTDGQGSLVDVAVVEVQWRVRQPADKGSLQGQWHQWGGVP